MLRQTFLSRGSVRRVRLDMADLAVLLGVFTLFYLLVHVGMGALVRFQPPALVPAISLDPRNLLLYAARSVLRMFVALGCSCIFTLTYGYAAARTGMPTACWSHCWTSCSPYRCSDSCRSPSPPSSRYFGAACLAWRQPPCLPFSPPGLEHGFLVLPVAQDAAR